MGNLKAIDKFFKWAPEAQRYLPVTWRRQVLPWWLTFDVLDVVGDYTIAGVAKPPISFRQQYFTVQQQSGVRGAALEIRALLVSPTSGSGLFSGLNHLVQFKELGEARLLMNQPVHMQTIFGTAQNPAILREPFFMFPQHVLQAFFTPASVVQTDTFRCYLGGAQFYPYGSEMQADSVGTKELNSIVDRWTERRKYVHPFWMTTDQILTVGVSASATQDIKVSEDGHFEIFTMNVYATNAVSIEISEVKTQQTLSNGKIHSFFMGTGTFPCALPTTYIVPAGSRLRVTATDLSGSGATVYLTLGGRKIYAPFKDVKAVLKDTAVEGEKA